MANDPRDASGLNLKHALSMLGRDEALRAELMAWLRAAEDRIAITGSVRDEVTGPIMDALHEDDDLYEKTLSDGTRFKFLYRTKIARDFLLSVPEHPTHVWEPQTTRLLQYLAGRMEGDAVIGGAYFGDHAILLGRQLSTEARVVHCFEPNSDQARMLEENGNINGLSNLRINRLGLWDKSDSRLKLAGFDSFANAVVTDDVDEGFATITIDDYCERQDVKLGVLMLDIEGAELAALQGAVNSLKQHKPAIVFEVHRDYVDWSRSLKKTPICELLSSLGYQLFAVRDFNTHQEMQGRPIELIPVDAVYLEGPPHGFNMLAIANDSLINVDLFKQVRDVSPKLLRHKAPALHHPLDGLPT